MKLILIYSGLYQRGATWRLPLERKKTALCAADIKTVVNVAAHVDEELAAWTEINYVHWPFADNHVPQGIEQLADIVANHHELGNVLVHCNGGRNRASLVTSLVLIRRGFTPSAAIEHVRQHRPNALANLEFERYLLSKENCHDL